MKINTKKVTVGMPPRLYEELEKLAAEKEITVPGYIRCILWRHVEKLEGVISRL